MSLSMILLGLDSEFCPLSPNNEDLDIERLKVLLAWKDHQNEVINHVIDDVTSFNHEPSINEATDLDLNQDN